MMKEWEWVSERFDRNATRDGKKNIYTCAQWSWAYKYQRMFQCLFHIFRKHMQHKLNHAKQHPWALFLCIIYIILSQWCYCRCCCWLLLLMPYRWWWCNIAIQCIQHTVHSLSLVSWCFDSSCILSDLNVTTLASNSHLPLEHHPYGWRAHAIYSKTKHKHRTTTVS